MNFTADNQKDLAALPATLRALLDAELAAGNQLQAIGHGHPAAPCGAWFRLQQPLLTRARASGDGIRYYDRRMPDHSGEITDDTGHFFLLEPPHPVGVEPVEPRPRQAVRADSMSAPPSSATRLPNSPLARFRESMVIDHEKWHDGIGYDLDALRAASAGERAALEAMLVPRATSDWRDVEALAALDTPAAHAALRDAFASGNSEIQAAVMRHAPMVVGEREGLDALLHALATSNFYGGLTQALDQVAERHPPEIIEALLRGTMTREGDVAMHFAAMLLFVHGKADSEFDWEHRPFLLQFHTEDPAERAAAYRELCERIGRPVG